MKFDGETYDQGLDGPRLTSQLERVKRYVLGLEGKWTTLRALALRFGSEASVSARLRDLRKEKYGGYVVERKRLGAGLWVYRVLPPKPKDAVQLELIRGD